MAKALKRISNVTTIRFSDDYTRIIIDMAAKLSNQTRTGFLLSVARKEAEEIIKEHKNTMKEVETFVLSQQASEVFVNSLLNPAQPNRALQKLAKDYKRASIVDRT